MAVVTPVRYALLTWVTPTVGAGAAGSERLTLEIHESKRASIISDPVVAADRPNRRARPGHSGRSIQTVECAVEPFGLETTLQVDPFQCSIRVRPVEPEYFTPTIQASPADTAAMPEIDPTSGLLTTAHVEPFQCSISV